MKSKRSEEAAKENLKASRAQFMRFMERNNLHSIKIQGINKQVCSYTFGKNLLDMIILTVTCIYSNENAGREAAASYPEDLANIIDEGGYTKE